MEKVKKYLVMKIILCILVVLKIGNSVMNAVLVREKLLSVLGSSGSLIEVLYYSMAFIFVISYLVSLFFIVKDKVAGYAIVMGFTVFSIVFSIISIIRAIGDFGKVDLIMQIILLTLHLFAFILSIFCLISADKMTGKK